MMLHTRELAPLASIFLLACWSDAPTHRPPRDAAADGSEDAPSEDAPSLERDAGPEGRERGLAGGLRDASSDGAIVGSRGTGALCGVNGRDDCGPFQVCDDVLGCAECAGDDDCPLTAKRCVRGACVECAEDGDCPAIAPSCWPKDHACHARCAADCPATEKFCTGGECWGCTSDADCPGARCSPSTRQCVACLEDADCPSTAPRCDARTSACVECDSNDDCGRAAPICDPATRACRIGCASDAQCPGKRCDPATARCVSAPEDAGADAADARND